MSELSLVSFVDAVFLCMSALVLETVKKKKKKSLTFQSDLLILVLFFADFQK